MVREYTTKLLDLIDEGVLTHSQIVDELLHYLSEDEVKAFCLEGFAGEIADLFNGGLENE